MRENRSVLTTAFLNDVYQQNGYSIIVTGSGVEKVVGIVGLNNFKPLKGIPRSKRYAEYTIDSDGGGEVTISMNYIKGDNGDNEIIILWVPKSGYFSEMINWIKKLYGLR